MIITVVIVIIIIKIIKTGSRNKTCRTNSATAKGKAVALGN